jgi:hypothetical protein
MKNYYPNVLGDQFAGDKMEEIFLGYKKVYF